MKLEPLRKTCILAAALAALSLAQDPQAIKDRIQRADDAFKLCQIGVRSRFLNHPESAEEHAWEDEQAALRAKANAEFTRTNQPRESLGIMPLTELGTGTYKGQQGGLYPAGRNTPPRSHLDAGLRIARSLAPLNSAGQPDPNGKIVLISIGYSNWTQEFSVFAGHAMADPERNPKVQVLDCALGGQSTEAYAHPEAEYYKVVDKRLAGAGLAPAQVQVMMVKVATQFPSLPFPWEPKFLEDLLVQSAHTLKARYPNVELMYVTSRIYAGYATSPLNPEPHAFETGFGVKWLIAAQIAGNPELNYDPRKGAVRAPWLAWGPYLWTDGTKGRKDGLKWMKEDCGDDGTHPSDQGREKVAKLTADFLKTDPTTKLWYLKQ